jgi:hypothetical protein
MLPGSTTASRPARQPAACAKPGERFTIVAARAIEELTQHIDAWDELGRCALEPNVFYEPWFAVPALRAFGADQDWLFVFIFESSPQKPGQAPVLAGFFPLVEKRGYKGLPVRLLTLWQHPYSVLGAPLVRRDSTADVWAAFFGWAKSGPHAAGLLRLPLFPGAGPLGQILVQDCHRQGRLSFVDEAYARALFLPRSDAETYRALAVGGHHNREVRRKERGLAKLGRLEFRVLEDAAQVPAWTDQFARLEARGWKGKEGTAFANREADLAFLRTLLDAAGARDRLLMLGLFLEDRPIALKCNLRAGDGAFAFKIAYDETLAKYSPGVLLELFNIDYLHEHRDIRWMNSCAVAGHPMIDRLWLDRRVIEDRVLSTGRCPGDFVVSLLPALRWLKRKTRCAGPQTYEAAP